MRSNFFLLLLLIFTSHLFSQESTILKGKILADSIEAPIHIINITAERGLVTEANGEFAIEVKKNDLVLFSSVQFQKKEIIITSEILASDFLEIELQKNLTELDEVRLHQLSGNLAKDIGGIETYDPRSLGFALSDKKPLSIEERKLSAMNSNPIGMMYGFISGESEILEKAIENNELKKLVYKAKDLVPNEFYTETLDLKENKIIDFLYYCSQNPNFKENVNKKDPLDIMDFFKGMICEYNDFIKD